MQENTLAFLNKAFSPYEIQFSEDFTKAVILNPYGHENITVYYYEDDDFTPYCVCFSFDHCHLTDEEDAIDWINEIIKGNKFSIEFFCDNRRIFGGSIEHEILQNLSYERLKQFTEYTGLTELLDIADSFKVRGWNRERSFDGIFCRDLNGYGSIKRATL